MWLHKGTHSRTQRIVSGQWERQRIVSGQCERQRIVSGQWERQRIVSGQWERQRIVSGQWERQAKQSSHQRKKPGRIGRKEISQYEDSDEYVYDSDEGATNTFTLTMIQMEVVRMMVMMQILSSRTHSGRQTGRRRRIQLLHLSSSCSLSSWMTSERRGQRVCHLEIEEVGSGYFRALFEIVLAQLRLRKFPEMLESHMRLLNFHLMSRGTSASELFRKSFDKLESWGARSL